MLSGFVRNVSDNSSSNASVPAAAVPCACVVPVTCVLSVASSISCGGIGEHLARALQDAGWQGRYIHRAVKKLCLPHATVPQIKQATGLDAAHLAEAVREADPKGEKTL